MLKFGRETVSSEAEMNGESWNQFTIHFMLVRTIGLFDIVTVEERPSL